VPAPTSSAPALSSPEPAPSSPSPAWLGVLERGDHDERLGGSYACKWLPEHGRRRATMAAEVVARCGALRSERRIEEGYKRMASSPGARGWQRRGWGRLDGDAMVDDERRLKWRRQ
jgi:hypothetical protein